MKQENTYLIVVGFVAVVALFILFSGGNFGTDSYGYSSLKQPSGSGKENRDNPMVLPPSSDDDVSDMKSANNGGTCGEMGGTGWCPIGSCQGKTFNTDDAPYQGYECCQGGCYELGCEIHDCDCSVNACKNDQLAPFCGVKNNKCVPDCYHFIQDGSNPQSEEVRQDTCLPGERDITHITKIFWDKEYDNPRCCLKNSGNGQCSGTNCYACSPYDQCAPYASTEGNTGTVYCEWKPDDPTAPLYPDQFNNGQCLPYCNYVNYPYSGYCTACDGGRVPYSQYIPEEYQSIQCCYVCGESGGIPPDKQNPAPDMLKEEKYNSDSST